MKSLDFSALYLLIAITSAASKSHCATQPAVATTYKPLTKGFPTNIDPLTATVQELNGLLTSGQVTSEQLVLEYLARIDRNNHQGLNLRSVIEPAPMDKVLAVAREVDSGRKSKNGTNFSPLYGIPIVVKDNMATDPALGMNSTAGSLALLPDNAGPVQQDATIIAKLRRNGAIIIGKANLSELSNFKGHNVNSGWSARGGQTQTPYVPGGPKVPGGDPCGSSSGTGSAVAAGFAPIGLGTETDGSIICPSNRHALYGMKPSVGVASRAGIVPISSTQDSPGPMAKSVWDLAALLGAMATTEVDSRDVATKDAVAKNAALTDYTQFLTKSFEGISIGVPNKSVFYTADDPKDTEIKQLVDESLAALEKMKQLGAKVQDADIPSVTSTKWPKQVQEGTVLNYDFKQDMAAYLSELGKPSSSRNPVRNLADLIAFNKEFASVEMPKDNCCQEIVEAAQETSDREAKEYKDAVAADNTISKTEGLDAVFKQFPELTVLAIPAEYSTSLPAMAGYPVATVPLGYYPTGQPFGLAFLARQYDEKSLIKVMSAFEANFPARKVPDSIREDEKKY